MSMFYCCVLFLFCVYFHDVSTVFSLVLVIIYFYAVDELSADTYITVLLLYLIPLMCLFLLCLYFSVVSTHRGFGWLFVGAGFHATSKGEELSCELD